MKMRAGVLLFSLAILAAGCASQPEDSAGHGEASGPGYLFPELGEVGLCQSPVNISSKAQAEGHHQVHLDYMPSAQRIINKGHTVELEYDSGSTVSFDGQVYEFRQFHFHTPSEHLIDGVTYPMEVHFVHTLKGDPGKYFVGAILWKEGDPNAFLGQFLDAIPETPQGEVVRESTVDVRDLLDGTGQFFTYKGSLTTPPYSETVRWVVLRGIREASREQIQRILSLEGNNARHIQPLNQRTVESE